MSAHSQFEPSAEAEYFDAIAYYAKESADAEVALRFVAAIESAITTLCASPTTWRVVGSPDVRRYVLRHFPYVIYYRYRAEEESVVIYAVMHTSRRPGLWRGRLTDSE